jgi:hypothetical protein
MTSPPLATQVRLLERQILINEYDPALAEHPIEYHRGVSVGVGTSTDNGLTHSTFVKAFTVLTGEEGSSVIVGSHKVALPSVEIVEVARRGSPLAITVPVRAGETCFFMESLLHGAPPASPGMDRVVIAAAYCPAAMAHHPNHGNLIVQSSPAWLGAVTPQQRAAIEADDAARLMQLEASLGAVALAAGADPDAAQAAALAGLPDAEREELLVSRRRQRAHTLAHNRPLHGTGDARRYFLCLMILPPLILWRVVHVWRIVRENI